MKKKNEREPRELENGAYQSKAKQIHYITLQ